MSDGTPKGTPNNGEGCRKPLVLTTIGVFAMGLLALALPPDVVTVIGTTVMCGGAVAVGVGVGSAWLNLKSHRTNDDSSFFESIQDVTFWDGAEESRKQRK